MAQNQLHGANIDMVGGRKRLSQNQPRKNSGGKQAPPGVLLVMGGFLLLTGIAAGVAGLVPILLGLILMGTALVALVGKKKGTVRSPRSDAQQTRRKAILRKKEKASYQSSATYREHYPHKEAPQAPIDWDNYREHIGPTKEKRQKQARELYEAGLLDKAEYLDKLREIENS